jgi:hypothetical protein
MRWVLECDEHEGPTWKIIVIKTPRWHWDPIRHMQAFSYVHIVPSVSMK